MREMVMIWFREGAAEGEGSWIGEEVRKRVLVLDVYMPPC